MKETITDFLQNEITENAFLTSLADKYTVSDFVMVDKAIKESAAGKYSKVLGSVYGCMYNCRDNYLCLNADIVEQRLTKMYLEFLRDVLSMEDEKEKVRYILTFHYLGVLEQLAFQLSVSSGAPFTFLIEEQSPRGKQAYASYMEVWKGDLHGMIPYISEDGIRKYHRMSCQYRYSALNAKHYSLLEYMLNQDRITGSEWGAEEAFVDMIDLFVFRYKAVFVKEMLCAYMTVPDCGKVIESLVEI